MYSRWMNTSWSWLRECQECAKLPSRKTVATLTLFWLLHDYICVISVLISKLLTGIVYIYICPWVVEPEPGPEPDRTSLERPENSCAATLPIQPDSAWEDQQRRMGETPQIQVCQACSVEAVWCQRCFNKVLNKGSEYLCKCELLYYYFC